MEARILHPSNFHMYRTPTHYHMCNSFQLGRLSFFVVGRNVVVAQKMTLARLLSLGPAVEVLGVLPAQFLRQIAAS